MNDDDVENEEQMRAALQRYFILSHDTLRGNVIDQAIEFDTGWTDKPPLIDDIRRFKLMCRAGVPACLRCAVWISSVYQIANPQIPRVQAETYATLGKIKFIEHGWDLVTKETFPDESDVRDALYPIFTNVNASSIEETEMVRRQLEEDVGMNAAGRLALTKVLVCTRHLLGVEYCPLLPDVAAILLTCMSESCAYFTIREMLNCSMSKYLYVSQVDHYACCRTFADLMKRFYPKTFAEMDAIGALSPIGLAPIFDRFFVPILPFRYVQRIMDVFTIEGTKVLFRFGIALLSMYKKPLKAMDIQSSEQWWGEVKNFTHLASFDFERLVKKAYGTWGNLRRKKLAFPKRNYLNRMMKGNSKWAESQVQYNTIEPIMPLGLIKTEVPAVLANESVRRAHLAEWLPRTLRDTKLELVFSTDTHGRTLERLYANCSKAKHSIMLLEVLDTGAVIGMFATEVWHRTNKVYGDGGCFLFKLSPDAKSSPWKPRSVCSNDSENTTSLMEQFMMSTGNYISMGGSHDGSCGLRLNEDLTRGSSDHSLTFGNDPLAGNDLLDFDVGLVEVYRFIRSIDGKPLDKMWDF
uniref:Oxidation resistance protein 1 n=1 Tax=Leptocylindrus danicus TaxID=163516 RepID=A0A7S2K1S0_9STRA